MDGVELLNRKHKLLFFSATDHGRENGMSEQVLKLHTNRRKNVIPCLGSA